MNWILFFSEFLSFYKTKQFYASITWIRTLYHKLFTSLPLSPHTHNFCHKSIKNFRFRLFSSEEKISIKPEKRISKRFLNYFFFQKNL